MIGDINFDADGDIQPSPFVVVRFSRHANNIDGVLPDGSNIAEVLPP
jgi:hypothetical protein